MAVGHAPKLVGQQKQKHPTSLSELVEHFEAQANILQEGGWQKTPPVFASGRLN